MEHRISRLRRSLSVGKKAWQSCDCRSGEFVLFYPQDPWYAENAPAMLQILRETQALLEDGLGLKRDGVATCLVAEPDWTRDVLGVAGLALKDTIIVACPTRCLSQFAAIAAHELAHLLSRSMGAFENPFKCEGFACYSAEIIDASTRPFGIPLHHHLGWMLHVGLRPSLAELWQRPDHSPELYDLAWSFATFAVERFGLERYAHFYAAVDLPLEARIAESFGVTIAGVERQWHAAARESVGDPAVTFRRLHRHTGAVCSRAAWLSGR